MLLIILPVLVYNYESLRWLFVSYAPAPYDWYFRLIMDTHNLKYRKSTVLCLLNRFWQMGCTVRKNTCFMCNCPRRGTGTPLYKPYRYMQPPKGGVFAPYRSEGGYRLFTLCSGIRYGFRGNHESAWTYLSFQFQINKKEKYAITSCMRIPNGF